MSVFIFFPSSPILSRYMVLSMQMQIYNPDKNKSKNNFSTIHCEAKSGSTLGIAFVIYFPQKSHRFMQQDAY